MSYTSRVYRHRNAHTHENDNDNEQSSFFKKADQKSAAGKGQKAFFQAKLSVNEPGDKYEKEADSVANKVTNHNSEKPAIKEEEKISGIQRLASSQAEEKLSTDEERMKRDKDIQTKPELQRKCSECEKEEKEKKEVQKKSDGASQSASPAVNARITESGAGGNTMPRNTMAEMQTAFSADFSKVRIHTDAEAADLNKQLNAQAFTHGQDIYFNNGKFNPETTPGKQLLAHELTHVIQQNGNETKKGSDKA